MGNSKRRMRSRKQQKIDKDFEIEPKKFIIGLSIFFMILFFSILFAILNSININILPRIQIEGISVSNLEINEAYQKVADTMKQRKTKDIILEYGEYQTTISLEQIEVKYDSIEAVNEAYRMGRNRNIIFSNYEILGTLVFGKKIETNITLDEEELDKKIEDIASKIPGVWKQSSYYIEENNLIIYPGEKGIEVKKEELKEQIKKAIEEQMKGKDVITLHIPTQEKQPDAIAIEKIHQEVYQEPQNASYQQEPFQLYPQTNGIDFAISQEEAKKLLEEEKEEYVIPLKVTVPEITIHSLGITVFPDTLGKYTTRYDESNKNRTNNIKLSSEKINGTILMPGETFSYNKVVGERTIKAGYKEAAVYMNGKVVDGIGGGICQVSSTMYNAALEANLEIVKRTNHYFMTSYVPASRDATVSYGTIDFQFKNNRKYPIKIECTAKNGISEVSILGIKEEVEYEVEIQNEITEVIPYTTKYVETNILAKGEENVVQQGTNGYKSQAYKIVKLNGKVVSKTLLSKDSYNPMQRVIEKGTK